MSSTALEHILKRDRFYIIAGLVFLAIGSWGYTIHMARAMTNACCPLFMPLGQHWTSASFMMMFMMWMIMMIAMMIPSAAPMIMIFASVHRRRQQLQKPYVPTSIFILGYMLIWLGFSFIATLLQWKLHAASLLSPNMTSINPIFGALILFCTGLFQFTPFKKTCLIHCSDPMQFIMTRWREGKGGACIMGIQHGGFCLGCCGLLMILLFVVGVMNIFWVTVITLFVLAEKLLKKSEWLSYLAGGLLIIWSIFMVCFLI